MEIGSIPGTEHFAEHHELRVKRRVAWYQGG